jgi:hypothetical protein
VKNIEKGYFLMKNYSKITPEGTKDYLAQESRAIRCAEKRLSSVFKSKGYEKVMTPTIEFFDVFKKTSSQKPSDKRHKRLKSAEKQGDSGGVTVVYFAHIESLAQRNRKCIHCESRTDE